MVGLIESSATQPSVAAGKLGGAVGLLSVERLMELGKTREIEERDKHVATAWKTGRQNASSLRLIPRESMLEPSKGISISSDVGNCLQRNAGNRRSYDGRQANGSTGPTRVGRTGRKWLSQTLKVVALHEGDDRPRHNGQNSAQIYGAGYHIKPGELRRRV